MVPEQCCAPWDKLAKPAVLAKLASAQFWLNRPSAFLEALARKRNLMLPAECCAMLFRNSTRCHSLPDWQPNVKWSIDTVTGMAKATTRLGCCSQIHFTAASSPCCVDLCEVFGTPWCQCHPVFGQMEYEVRV